MTEQFIYGDVREVKIYPFVMKRWESNIVYRSWNKREALSFPAWFRMWLWLRTVWVKIKTYGK
jgi:hypothetical protein